MPLIPTQTFYQIFINSIESIRLGIGIKLFDSSKIFICKIVVNVLNGVIKPNCDADGQC